MSDDSSTAPVLLLTSEGVVRDEEASRELLIRSLRRMAWELRRLNSPSAVAERAVGRVELLKRAQGPAHPG